MWQAAELSRPVVGAGAGLHADQAGRQLGDHRQQLAAGHLGFDKNRLAALVNTMQSEYILCEITVYRDYSRGLPLSNE